MCDALKAAKPLCAKAFAENVERRLPEFRAANPGAPDDVLRRAIQDATEGEVLGPDFVVYWVDKEHSITVRDLLGCLEWLGDPIDLLDPCEPDYNGGRQVARAYLNADAGTAYIHSFAHGGRTFDLTPAFRELQTLAWASTVRLPEVEPGRPFDDGSAKGGALSAIFTARDLKNMAFQPQKFICDGLISEGCALLGARPKIGKSWFALDLAYAVATGGEVLGRRCEQGDVLYLALEDTPRRLKERLAKIVKSEDDWSQALQITNDWPKGDAAIAKLHEWRASVKNPRLVIVDTFQKVKAPSKRQSGPGYAEDYEAGAAFQSFAKETGISDLLIHHTTKANPEDPFDALSGTLGTNAAPDSLLVIMPFKKGPGLMLHGKGRDLAEYATPITFDADLCRWVKGEIVEEHKAAAVSKLQEAMAWLRDFLRPGPVSADEVSEAAKANGVKDGTLQNAKRELGIAPWKKPGHWGEWMWSLPGETKPPRAPVSKIAPSCLGSLAN